MNEEWTEEAEAIERQALTALHQAADEPLRQELGLALEPAADGIASIASALPPTAITINRALGLGRERPIHEKEIRALVERYRDAGVERFFLQPDPATRGEEVAPLCEAAGLKRARAWQKFRRGRDEPLPEVETGLPLCEVGREDGEAFAAIVCDAFDLGRVATPWLARLPAAEGWHAWMAFDGDTPASAGALFVSGRAAFTDFGATAPAYRQRGLQAASLACRVRAAIELGCVRIHSSTGVAVAGDPQHSYSNIKRCGFVETHVREAWRP